MNEILKKILQKTNLPLSAFSKQRKDIPQGPFKKGKVCSKCGQSELYDKLQKCVHCGDLGGKNFDALKNEAPITTPAYENVEDINNML